MRGRGYSNVVRIRWQGGGKTRFCSNNHCPSHVETRGEGSIHSREELSPKPSHPGTLISDFQPPQLQEKSFLCLSHSVRSILL